MSCYRVTHIDVHHRRRRLRVQALNRAGAVAWVNLGFTMGGHGGGDGTVGHAESG